LPVAAIVIGLAFGVLFVHRQLRLNHPLLDVGLFRTAPSATHLTMTLLGGVFLAGTTLLVSQFLQLVHGLSPLSAGLWLVPAVVAMIAAAQSGPVLARQIRPACVIAAGQHDDSAFRRTALRRMTE
jgi:DHA2 family multidrug resistance protein-like MFS transporter